MGDLGRNSAVTLATVVLSFHTSGSTAEDMSTDDSAKTVGNTDPKKDASWTENQLPPVKPPTTGLLMQLFFVPMIIVSIIVSVWLMFGWLAQSSTNPEQLTKNLKQLNKGSWQDAHSLSTLLRDPREKELRQNAEMAEGLAEILDGLLDDKTLIANDKLNRLATWLCRALGEFEVDAGLDTLVKASQSSDYAIRRAAVEGISTLAGKLDDITASREDIVQILREPALAREDTNSREEEMEAGEMRSVISYALGIIGDQEANDTLSLMLSDPYPEARYNAATGLARNGDLRAVPRLEEMLQIDNPEAVRYEEESETLRTWKRNLVMLNGLRAVNELYTTNAEAVMDENIIKAVRKIESAGLLQNTDASKYVLDEVIRLVDTRGPSSAGS